MRNAAVTAVLSLVVLAAAPDARAATTLEVLATAPAMPPATGPGGASLVLARNETFYLRVAYTTDEPVRIWARPWFEGREVGAGTNPSRVHTGSGETLAWFFFLGDPGQQVDEIRLAAGDGTPAGTEVLATLPVRITSGSFAATASAAPEWLTRLQSEEERLQREDYERRMSEPVSAGDSAFAAGFMLAMLALGIGGIAAPVWYARRWDGAWRYLAAAPAVVVGFVVLRIVIDTALDPTSHNLWPFEIVMAGGMSFLAIGILRFLRRITGVSPSA